MASVSEYHIPWLDIELERLLALVQEREDLRLREVKYVAPCLVPKALQRHRRRLEMVADDTEHRQASRMHLQPS
jgi:hypothetical protein